MCSYSIIYQKNCKENKQSLLKFAKIYQKILNCQEKICIFSAIFLQFPKNFSKSTHLYSR